MSFFSRWIRLVPALVLLLAASLACRPDEPDAGGEVTPSPSPAPAVASCVVNGTLPYLDCPAFPNTSATAQPQWDYFAWNSFFAANWPALDPATNNWQRGFPDLNQSFVNAAGTSLLTWETFKEKREVFFYPPTTNVDPGAWNQEPNYGPIPSTPLCSDSQGKPAVPTRLLGQGGKLVYDSLDETVEVLSEALEQPAALCGGFTKNPCSADGTGKPDCSCLVGLPVAPRVWKGSPTKTNPQPVLYEVKVNYDFYHYVRTNKLYLDSMAEKASGAPDYKDKTKIRLPYRTSAVQGSGGPGPSAVTSYDSRACLAAYSKVGPNTNMNPCPVGSIHIKTAWIPIQNEDASKYHTAEAAYFKTENGKACMSYATFGMVGIHIIQRVHTGAGASSAPVGGTFVFSTWEHVDNDQAGFTYSNYFPGQPFAGPPQRATFYPQPSAALPVTRKYPILPGTQKVNSQVHTAIKAVNPNSVWLNYQLVGTQFQAIDIQSLPPNPANPNDPTGIGQPLYLANLVIETNEGLQHFQGLPPLVSAAAPFSKVIPGNHTLAFNRSASNMTFSPTGNPSALKGFNMGGCMGCHGVAQTKGYSFSFVLFDGQAGADVDTQTNFALAPVSR